MSIGTATPGTVRLPSKRKVRLRGAPGSEEFLAEYHAALEGHTSRPAQAGAAKRGSFRYLCQGYYASAGFNRLDISTQSWQRRALDEICDKHADKPVALLQARHIRKLRDEKADLPGAAKNRLKALRALFKWAVEAEEAPQNPTLRRAADQVCHQRALLVDTGRAQGL
jgi:hypothetical protein